MNNIEGIGAFLGLLFYLGLLVCGAHLYILVVQALNKYIGG